MRLYKTKSFDMANEEFTPPSDRVRENYTVIFFLFLLAVAHDASRPKEFLIKKCGAAMILPTNAANQTRKRYFRRDEALNFSYANENWFLTNFDLFDL